MTELSILQAIRLKGRCTAEAAAAFAGTSGSDAEASLRDLVAAGLAKEAGSATRLTPEGKQRLVELVAAEAATVDRAALERLYELFDGYNNELKVTMTAWQLEDADTPNDHQDAAYDRAVADRLLDLHGRFASLLGQIIELAGRLAPYATRFDHAAARIRDGDHGFIARPIIDSYHTVWFELHEELIGLLGRTRAEEAAAGRAV